MIVILQGMFIVSGEIVNYLAECIKNLYETIYPKEDDIDETGCCADYDEERGVIFYPTVCAQRYSSVIEVLTTGPWKNQIEKVIDLGCHDTSFITHLKDIPTVKEIVGVDLDLTLESCMKGIGNEGDLNNREIPLHVKLLQGNAREIDSRLFNADAVVSIELIEHMTDNDLGLMVVNVFGHIKPWVTVITTPNGEFNVLFKSLLPNGFRRLDHFFEWTRTQFQEWAHSITNTFPEYTVTFKGIGPGPPGTENVGCCTQMAIFVNTKFVKKEHRSEQKPKFIIGDAVGTIDVNKDSPIAYNLIKEYRYPNEAFSTDNQILEIIRKQFRRKTGCYDGNITVCVPLSKIIESVNSLSSDRRHVRDLLEWNGFIIENGQVYSKCWTDLTNPATLVEESWD